MFGRKDLALGCPIGYTQRSKPNGDLHCFKSVTDGTCPVGNPTQPASGTKLLEEIDFTASGPGALHFSRHYNSLGYFRAGSGSAVQLQASREYWKHSYERRLYPIENGWVVLQFPNGVIRYFDADGKETQNRDGQAYTLLPQPSGGWMLTTPRSDLENYDAGGRLISMQTRSGLQTTLQYDSASRLEALVDHFGRSLVLGYDAQGRLSSVITPDNQSITYTYNADDMPTAVQFSDQTSRHYHYEDASNPYLLSGFSDERGVRLTTYLYDAAFRVTETTRPGNISRLRFSYPSTARTVMTDALGTARNFDYAIKGGVFKQTAMSQPCSTCGGSSQNIEYDSRGNVSVRVEFGGRRTHYEYDPVRNLEVLRTEGLSSTGATTSQTRTTSTQWHAQWRLPVRIERAGVGETPRVETFSYDTSGNLLSRSQSAAGLVRTSSYTFDALGRTTQMDGPRTDVADISTYTYSAADDACTGCRGQLQTVINPLGHVSEYLSYDAAGRLLRLRDANGVEFTLTYDTRGRLKTRTSDATGSTPLTTTMHYDAAGLLIRTQSPQGDTHYEYDLAQRLIAVSDAVGNRIEYVLDASGNRKEERTLDPQGALTRRLRREMDSLGRTLKQLGGTGHASHFEYDAADRVVATLDAEQNLSVSNYDVLGRLVSSQDALRGNTVYGYDSDDRLTSVTDAEGHSTAYHYHPLGDLLQLVSPDTGTTSYGYDGAGQRTSQTDARGVQTSYQHDALGRLTLIDYGSAALNVQMHYDESNAVTGCSGSYPVGRLTRMTDASGQTAWCYDAHGRITDKRSTVGGQQLALAYRYNGDGRLIGLRYPSGGELQIVRDAAGRATRVDWAPQSGPTRTVLGQISHLPMGPINRLQFGNGQTQLRHYDADYRLVALDGLELATDSRAFAYDSLQRLAQEANSDGSEATAYDYDAIGNRLAKSTDAGTDVYSYASDSHRLIDVAGQARSFDAAGNTTGIGAQGLTYDARNRLVGFSGAQSASYQYNGRGERVQKQVGSDTRRFAYDEAGHLLGEYDSAGAARQEFLWLDDLPIGVVAADGSVLSVQTDQLQTPRVLANATGTVVWRWNLGGDAFGGDAAQNDPDGDGVSVEFNLRFPGQYFDAESGLHYNYFRDYEASTGRYIESDPIGLGGGINTYAYAEHNPIMLFDMRGESGTRLWEYFQCKYQEQIAGVSLACDKKQAKQAASAAIDMACDAIPCLITCSGETFTGVSIKDLLAGKYGEQARGLAVEIGKKILLATSKRTAVGAAFMYDDGMNFISCGMKCEPTEACSGVGVK